MDIIHILKRFWHFLWKEDSFSSWLVSLVLLVFFIKFIFYPLLGLFLGTGFPVVAVLSGSMEHNSFFNDWWDENSLWYIETGFIKEEFRDFTFHNGFNQGDIILIYGIDVGNIKKGDVVVYDDHVNRYPIIHRVTEIKEDENRKSYKFQTKGDNNFRNDGSYVEENQVLGKAFLRIPLLGWVKIWATDIWNLFIGGFAR